MGDIFVLSSECRRSFPSRFRYYSLLTVSLMVFVSAATGCSSISNHDEKMQTAKWLGSGELSFGGPLPAAEGYSSSNRDTDQSSYDNFSYGFSPVTSGKGANSGAGTSGSARTLILNISDKKARLLQSGKEIASAKLLDTNGFVPGTYKIAHRQRNPLWYAPDAYFSTRGMQTPAAGDKQRYLRGAFGDFALFISPTQAIHCGPFPLEEVTSVRVDEQDFSRIFYLIEVGDNLSVE